MRTITVSAPGKLMLLGEHAVVYGHPCIVTAVDQRLFCKAEFIDKKGILQIDAPDVDVTGYEKSFSALGKGDIPKGAMFVEIALKNFFEFVSHSEPSEESNKDSGQVVDTRKGARMTSGLLDDKFSLHITTKSDFKSTFGFGSSSASTVCTIKALAELFEIRLSNKDMFDLSYKTVLDVQGSGSGFDVASAIYGGTIYFKNKGETIIPVIPPSPPRQRRGPSPSGRGGKRELPLVVGYSGIKADTVTLIKHVAKLGVQKPDLVENIFSQIDELVEKGKEALEKQDFKVFGNIMDQNQVLLEQLGVSTEKLDTMISAARSAGAYGAKLSGAGGGDCMIALRRAQGKHAIAKAIESVGGEIIDVKTNAEGVRVEVDL